MSNSLLPKIQRNRKILPLFRINPRRPNLLIRPIQHLERVLPQTLLPNHRPRLKIKLIRRIIRRLMPHVQILMTEIQRPLGILLDAKVNRLDPTRSRTSRVRVALELQPCSAEALLRLEDARVADGDFEGLVGGGVVEAGVGDGFGELDDLGPLEGLAFYVFGVEGGGGVAVEVGECRGGLDAAVEDDGAFDRGVGGVEVWFGGVGEDGGCCSG